MNEELTNEALEAMERCGEDIGDQCTDCPAKRICHAFDALVRIKFLATALLEERAKPKVWDGAPEDATVAKVVFQRDCRELLENLSFEAYTRELPKTRIDEIADEMWHEINKGVTGLPKDVIKRWLKKYAEELEGKE